MRRDTEELNKRLSKAAGWYLQHGFAIFSCDGKRPSQLIPQHEIDGQRVRSWQECITRLDSKRNLTTWWSDERAANIGLATGKASSVIVVDCDNDDAARWWWANRPQTNVMTLKGVHVYYGCRLDLGEVRNRTNAAVDGQRRGIDIRGEGGYVVAAPSAHPDGGEYSRITQGVDNAWGMRLMPRFNPSWIDPPGQVTETRDTDDPVRSATNDIGHIHAVAGQSGHNDTYRAVCMLKRFEIPRDQALEIMLAWNETNAKPKWSERELVHKINSEYG